MRMLDILLGSSHQCRPDLSLNIVLCSVSLSTNLVLRIMIILEGR